jgi:hypothetical protein
VSLLRRDYLNHLREQMDEEGDDIPAEAMTPEVRDFFDRLFLEALDTPAAKIRPVRKGCDEPPGPLRVLVYMERFRKGQAIFSDLDLKWEQIKAKGGKKCTSRHPLNGNALEHAWVSEREVLEELRADEAARKARRS